MAQEIALYQVDAFTSKVFSGNPAAVCPLTDWLPDDVMQAIALENSLSETAFFVPRNGHFELRWFTPAIEVALCGHATLASGYVISELLEPGRSEMRFESKSGPLKVTRDGKDLTLDFPANPPVPVDETGPVADALRQQPLELLKADRYVALLPDEAAVHAARPDMAAVAALGCGLIVTATSKTYDFVSRYFAPHAGIPEDPVTGSAHCVLTPFWAARLGKQRMKARQVSARGGELTVEQRGDRVLISGQAALYMIGRITI